MLRTGGLASQGVGRPSGQDAEIYAQLSTLDLLRNGRKSLQVIRQLWRVFLRLGRCGVRFMLPRREFRNDKRCGKSVGGWLGSCVAEKTLACRARAAAANYCPCDMEVAGRGGAKD